VPACTSPEPLAPGRSWPPTSPSGHRPPSSTPGTRCGRPGC
jgi:hypothetical protein